jgi:Uma2 family endonuclease
MQTLIHKHLFTLSDYYRMADNGVFSEDAHTELIDGEVIDMAPIGSKHASVVSFLAQTFTLQLGNQAIVRVQDPIQLGDLSVPQPDLALVKPKADFYREQHPVAHDVLLLIEVADSTVDYDLKIKMPLYARYGIVECWVIDLQKNKLFRFTEPHEKGYRMQRNYQVDEIIAPEKFNQIQISLASLLV